MLGKAYNVRIKLFERLFQRKRKRYLLRKSKHPLKWQKQSVKEIFASVLTGSTVHSKSHGTVKHFKRTLFLRFKFIATIN